MWVTTPRDKSFVILDAATLKEKSKLTFEGNPEGFAVDAKRHRFYTNLGFFVLMGGMELSRGLWQYQLLDLERLLVVIVPLLTMRLVAEERKLGTLELLLTMPVAPLV